MGVYGGNGEVRGLSIPCPPYFILGFTMAREGQLSWAGGETPTLNDVYGKPPGGTRTFVPGDHSLENLLYNTKIGYFTITSCGLIGTDPKRISLFATKGVGHLFIAEMSDGSFD